MQIKWFAFEGNAGPEDQCVSKQKSRIMTETEYADLAF